MTRISWINVALGLWLAVAAFALAHSSGVGVTEDLISGSVVALSALWAARAYRPRISIVASWTVALVGLWVAAAPFALGYERESASVANEVIVGLAILALGMANLVAKDRRITARV
jgi:hypothetical protein